MPDVTKFLDELGLSQYRQAFLENAVDHDLLPVLSDADLRELGVAALGHRKRILTAAARITETAEVESRAQRRQLTLMFADLADSTRLSNTIDLEAYREVIRAYQDGATKVIEAYGGYVAKYLGDGILAYFGYPQSHENDAERAIRAGCALVERVPEIDTGTSGLRLRVRIGIETGPVVVGEIIGEATAQEHAVVGETPNLAARLQSIAEPDTVVTGPVTRRLAMGAGTFHSLGEHDLKGFSAPIPVWRVDAVAGAADRLERGTASELGPLIGRRPELGALASAFARMRAGEALIVQVIGEAGIGKSRLVHEFVNQTGELAFFLSGHCASHGGSTAFFPFIDLLRRWLGGVAGGDVADGAEVMDRLVASGLDGRRHAPYLLNLLEIPHPAISDIEPDLIGVRTQEALARFVGGFGQIRPTVLFINDLHWIDERSTTMLDALVRSADRQGLLILATFRTGFKPPWHDLPGVEEISLTPLSATDSLNLFQSRVAGDATDSDVAEIVDRAGGNPLFLEELARHVEGASQSAGATGDSAIPETLAGLLMQRVDALTTQARRASETAAVAGRRFAAGLLGDEAALELAALEQSGIILPEDGTGAAFRFHHALVQEVIYDSLLEADRRRLHMEVGSRLEARHVGREIEVAEDLARHFGAAGDGRAAARYSYMAGTKALDLFALRDAETWYGKCLSLVSAEGEAEDDLLLARAVVNQTQVLCWNGDFTSMVGLAQRYLPRIRALGEIEEVSRALTWIGEGYMHVARYDDARSTLGHALESGRALGNESCVGYASCELMWLDSIVGEGTCFESLPTRSVELEALAGRLGDNFLATLAHYARWTYATQSGRMAVALETARRLRAHGESSNYPPAICWGACMEGYCQAKAGNAFEAERAADAGRDAAACPFDHLMADLALGMTLVTVGRFEAGLALLKTAPWRTDEIGALYFAYAGDVTYGGALAAVGRVEEARDWLREGIAWFEHVGNRRAACMAALELARILIDAAEHTGSPFSGLGSRLRTFFNRATDPYAEARVCLDQVRSTGAALAMQSACAEAMMLQARLAARDSDHAAARGMLAEAHALVAPLGWPALERQINAEIRRLGANGPDRRQSG